MFDLLPQRRPLLKHLALKLLTDIQTTPMLVPNVNLFSSKIKPQKWYFDPTLG